MKFDLGVFSTNFWDHTVELKSHVFRRPNKTRLRWGISIHLKKHFVWTDGKHFLIIFNNRNNSISLNCIPLFRYKIFLSPNNNITHPITHWSGSQIFYTTTFSCFFLSQNFDTRTNSLSRKYFQFICSDRAEFIFLSVFILKF